MAKTGRKPVWVGKKRADAEREIIGRLSQGATLTSICKDDHLPDISTVLAWVQDGKAEGGSEDDRTFAEAYARARSIRGMVWGDQIIDIADEGIDRNDMAEVGRKRERIDARKWILARQHPDEYGDHQKVEATLDVGVKVVDRDTYDAV
jgi:SOS response regulatory protein OraA/RecX